MSFKIVVPVVPGTIVSVPIKNPSITSAIKLSNGTPFDLDVSGFGTQGQEVVVAGVEMMFYGDTHKAGTLDILPVNNNNISGTGVVNIVVYIIGENLPTGHWPVTIPTQTVQAKVSTVTTLVNDGSALGTQIIESTPTGAAGSTISILNDGTFTIKGDVAAVLTMLLQLIPGAGVGASSVKLSDSTRTTEILGKLLIDGVLSALSSLSLDNGNITSDGLGNLISKSLVTPNTGTGIAVNAGGIGINAGGLSVTGSAAFNTDVKTNTIRDNVTGVDQIDLATAGITINNTPKLSSKQLSDGVPNLLIDWTVGGINFNGNQGNFSRFAFFSKIGTVQPDWSLHGIAHSNFTGSASGTFNHNLLNAGAAALPSQYFMNPSSVAGSQTFGFNSPSTTTVAVVLGATNTFSANALNF